MAGKAIAIRTVKGATTCYTYHISNTLVMTKALTCTIPLTRTFQSVSIIPYTEYHGRRHYFMCIDAIHREITGPGGCREKGETFIDTATRELDEETIGLFSFRSAEEKAHIYNNSVSLFNQDTLLIFQRVGVTNPLSICQTYQYRYWQARHVGAPSHYLENLALIWISEDDLRSIVCTGRSEPVAMPPELGGLIRSPHTAHNPKAYTNMYPPLYSRLRAILVIAYTGTTTLL